MSGDNNGAEDEGEEWDPQPCELREGEERDISGHVARTLAQLRVAQREGRIDQERYESVRERLLANEDSNTQAEGQDNQGQ